MVNFFQVGTLFTAFISAVAAASYPNPGTVKGATFTHDPTIVKTPTGTYIEVYTSPKLSIVTSTDRITWTAAGSVFPNGAPQGTYAYTQAGADANLWAPDLSIQDGKYLLYYAASSFGSQTSGIFLATSTTGLSGSWVDQGLVLSSSSSDNYNAIDPQLSVDAATGRWWLTYGSFWSGIQIIEISPSTGKVLSGAQRKNISSRPASVGNAEEAPQIWQDGGYYYLFTSWDKCCSGLSSTYSIHVSRATSITGPYTDKAGVAALSGGGTEILSTHDSIVGPGGQSIFKDVDGAILVYHYYTSTDSQLAINLLKFQGGWPVVA
ncbi:arabinan endo--alpha-l-arabinosidase [Phaffia rhodozyma]|uniref:Arabinan endo-1,5-alpha-L-arabinosidase n=1 Tax=Phaffia rhodozyma TaxID=264483 RepID=A0A0F7SGM5_PHARH|nr:arabinan endo--alpha-l-arabinosidase [Phaffia rhodozyma]